MPASVLLPLLSVCPSRLLKACWHTCRSCKTRFFGHGFAWLDLAGLDELGLDGLLLLKNVIKRVTSNNDFYSTLFMTSFLFFFLRVLCFVATTKIYSSESQIRVRVKFTALIVLINLFTFSKRHSFFSLCRE